MASPKIAPKRLSLALVLLLAPANAWAIYAHDDGLVEVDGSFRTVNAVTDNYFDAPPVSASSQSILRLTMAGFPTEWLSYELHLVGIASANTTASQLTGFGSSDRGLRYRTLDDRWIIHQDSQVALLGSVDRLNVKLMLPWFDVTIGRQAMTFGKAYFWNPMDVFLSFDSTAFDRDYKRGVDALRVDIAIGDFSGITLVGVLGRPNLDGEDHSFYRSAIIAQAYSNFFEWDFTLQAGKIHGGIHASGGAAGELGPVELRLEGAYFYPLDDLRPDGALAQPEHVNAVIGIGRFWGIDQHTLSVQVEYLFNSAGKLDSLETLTLVGRGFLRQASQHVLGTVISYDPFPLLGTSLALLVSLDANPSVLIQPGMVYSAADEVDVLVGALIAVGDRPQISLEGFELGSEFGTYPNVFYAEIKVYF